MNKYIFYILFFVSSLNLYAQKIKSLSPKNDLSIKEFLIDNNISANDFFILNPGYVNSRFDFEQKELEKKIFKGDVVTIIYLENLDEKNSSINFISHKIRRKQNLNEISKIYNVSEKIILKFN